jgi:hypothetical protein
VHAVFDRHGPVSRGRKRRYKAQGTTLSKPLLANDLWCADHKGEFMLADRRYCYPFTISDFASRCLLSCEVLSSTKETYAFTVFERVFKEFGLPKAIRTDNGVPFANPHALFGLSKLAVRPRKRRPRIAVPRSGIVSARLPNIPRNQKLIGPDNRRRFTDARIRTALESHSMRWVAGQTQ